MLSSDSTVNVATISVVCHSFNDAKCSCSLANNQMTQNVPVDKALYARVKAAAQLKFKVYPSAYANAWVVREYKKRGGRYRVVKG